MRRFFSIGTLAAAILAVPTWVVAQDPPPGPPRDAPKPEAVFKAMDKNADGQLNLEEFTQGMKRLHARLQNARESQMRRGGPDVRRPMGPPPMRGPGGPPMAGPHSAPWMHGPQGPPMAGRHGGPPWMHGSQGPQAMRGHGGPRSPWHGGPPMAHRDGPPARPDMAREALARAAKWYEKADANKDGKIDESEVPEGRREAFKKVLARADKDGDKAISKEEGKAMLKAMAQRMAARHRGPGPRGMAPPEAARQRIIERFKAADANKDGKLSREEAPDRLKENFSKIDADADGQLTPAELKAAVQAHRKDAAKKLPRIEKKVEKKHDGEKKAAKHDGKKPDKPKAEKKDGPPKPPKADDEKK